MLRVNISNSAWHIRFKTFFVTNQPILLCAEYFQPVQLLINNPFIPRRGSFFTYYPPDLLPLFCFSPREKSFLHFVKFKKIVEFRLIKETSRIRIPAKNFLQNLIIFHFVRKLQCNAFCYDKIK